MTWWRRLLRQARRITLAVAGVLRRGLRAAARAVTAARTAAVRAAGRHRDRAADDRSYGRTVSVAVSELVTTMMPRPALAGALAVALAGLLSPGEQPPPSPYWAHDRHQASEYGTHQVRRTGSPEPTGPLWDRFGT